MNARSFRRWSIYFTGGFFLLLLTVLVLQGLFFPEESEHGTPSGPECVSTTFGLRVSGDNYLEGVAATNCESGPGLLLGYHVYDAAGRLLEYEGIRFPSVGIKGNQVGFFRIPLNSLGHYPADALDIRFDWLRDHMYWLSDRYVFTNGSSYRFERAGTPLAIPDAAACHVVPANFNDGLVIGEFEQLTGLAMFRASVDCPVPERTYLTYHLLDASGYVLEWDVAGAQDRMVCTESFDRKVVALANATDVDETVFPLTREDVLSAARTLEGAALLPACLETEAGGTVVKADAIAAASVNNARIWRHGDRLARVVLDVLQANGDGAADDATVPAVINVEAEIDRIEAVVSLIPRILPADDYVLVPAFIRVERDSATPTPFRLSMEVHDAAGMGRYETERTALSTNPENTYQFKKISFRTPAAGVWNVNVGYVFDPYMWYSDVFPVDDDRVVFVNPLVFMLLVLLSLYLLRGLLRFFKEDHHWYGKLLTAGAMLGVLGLFGISAVLTIAGLSALMVYMMLKLARSRRRFRDPWLYYVLMAFAYGVLMEAFWSVHYADVHQHAVVLSASLHAFVALLVVLVARTDTARRIALSAWFILSGSLYLLVVSYLKFFGEPPRYSIYQYAGQAMDVADSALVLLASREWLGILLVLFSAALVFFTRSQDSK